MSYSHTAASKFKVASWSESTYVDIDGEGTGTLVYLIAYKADAAPVLGLERFTGSIGGHEGSCVFRHVGSQDAGSVSARIEVVPGMGTGGLEGLVGEAELAIAGHSEDGYDLVLSYDIR
jgi:hypothetical protein